MDYACLISILHHHAKAKETEHALQVSSVILELAATFLVLDQLVKAVDPKLNVDSWLHAFKMPQ